MTAVIARYVDAVEPLMVVACAAGCMCVVEAVGRLCRAALTAPSPPSAAATVAPSSAEGSSSTAR